MIFSDQVFTVAYLLSTEFWVDQVSIRLLLSPWVCKSAFSQVGQH